MPVASADLRRAALRGAEFRLVFFRFLSLYLWGFPGLSEGASRAAPEEPQLQPEPELGMHTVALTSLAADPSGAYLLTGSKDGTARLWSSHDQALLQVFHAPAVQGMSTTVTAVAISADAATLAVATQVVPAPATPERAAAGSSAVFLVDRRGLRPPRRALSLPGPARALFFSGSPNTLWVLPERGRTVHTITLASDAVQQRRIDCEGALSAADMTADGRLATACSDGFVRIYGRDGQVHVQTGGLPAAASLRFAPNGGKLAIAYSGRALVEVRSADTLQVLARPQTLDITQGDLHQVAWDSTGTSLFATGSYSVSGQFMARHWRSAESVPSDLPLGREPATAVLSLPERARPAAATSGKRGFAATSLRAARSFLVGTAEPSLVLVSAESGVTPLQIRRAARILANSLVGDATGGRVYFETEGAQPQRLVFSVLEHTVRASRQPSVSSRAEPAAVEAAQPGQSARISWRGGRGIQVPAGIEPVHAVPLPSGSAVLSTARGQLMTVDPAGRAGWLRALPAAPSALTTAAEGRLIVTALADGTLRWFAARDGQLLLSLLCGSDPTAWVA